MRACPSWRKTATSDRIASPLERTAASKIPCWNSCGSWLQTYTSPFPSIRAILSRDSAGSWPPVVEGIDITDFLAITGRSTRRAALRKAKSMRGSNPRSQRRSNRRRTCSANAAERAPVPPQDRRGSRWWKPAGVEIVEAKDGVTRRKQNNAPWEADAAMCAKAKPSTTLKRRRAEKTRRDLMRSETGNLPTRHA